MKIWILAVLISLFSMSCVNKKILTDTGSKDSLPITESELVESRIDPLADDENAEADLEELFDEWSSLRSDPIHLNKASLDDFLRLPGFRPSYARAFIKYRKSVGRFSSYKEVETIKGIPQEIWDHAKQFTTLGSPLERVGQSLFNIHYWTPGGQFESISRVKFPLERSIGYETIDSSLDRPYQGPPVDRYQRFMYTSKRIRTGVTMRSGMGSEGSWFQPNWSAAYLQLNDLPFSSNVVIGDYRLNWGLGLGMNSSRSARKGSDLVQLTPRRNPLSSHTGSSYLGHHSGIALRAGLKSQVLAWGSRRAYTASELDSSTLRWSTSEPYFRTRSEVLKRDNLELEHYGVRLSHHGKALSGGVFSWLMQSDLMIGTSSTYIPETTFRARTFSMVGSDVQWNFERGSLLAEWAMDRDKQLAGILACEFNPIQEINVSAIYRNYSPGFQSPYGASFSAWSGQPKNELGFYSGMEIIPNNSIRTLFFLDHYRSHLPRSNDLYLGKGSDIGWKTIIKKPNTEIELIVRHKVKTDELEKIDGLGRSLILQIDEEQYNLRIQVKHATQVRIDWSTRVEWVHVASPGEQTEQGYQIYQDLFWKPHQALRVQARVAIFSTDGYPSRLYAFEPDVALSSVIPAFQGQGSRHFLLIVSKPHPNVEARMKWAKLFMPHEYRLGSGNDLIEENQKTTIHLSLRVRV